MGKFTGQLKLYISYVFGIMAIVFFWTGMWDGIGNLGPMSNPIISFIVGVMMLSLSVFIFKDANPLWGKGSEKDKVLLKLRHSNNKHEYHIVYHDKLAKGLIKFKGDILERIEKGHLVLIENGREKFIPKERVKAIFHKGKPHWKEYGDKK